MFTNYLQYNFDTETITYPSSYDSTKLNLGHLMYKKTNDNGEIYVSPLEPKFFRGYEILRVTPYSYAYQIDSLGSLKYDDDTIWLFYAGGGSQGTIAKRIFLAIFKKSTNELIEVGSIQINNPAGNNSHQCYTILPSLENHTGGTITVSGSSVTGLGTTWLTDGVCVGNRIGFGSNNPSDITTWYKIDEVNSESGLTISKEYVNDGNISTLNITGATSYVIEDFRIIYMNYAGNSSTIRGIMLVKGLRYELFSISPITIPGATTIDNIRACYRILDSPTTSATFRPFGGVLMDKSSFINQDLYVMSNLTSQISIQKFNIRASLTLTAGRSNSPYIFTTGNQAHGGSNITGYIPMVTDYNNNFYVTTYTRICRIPISGITSSSTSFIADSMIENPPGTSTTYPLSSQLFGGQYLREADKFYISHNQGTIRNYVTSYIVSGEFDRPIHINDQTQQGTYLVDKFDNLTTNFLSVPLNPHYNDGILFLVRGVGNNNNIIYTLPIEADEDYHTITNSYIITPELSTLSATSYFRVYVDVDTFFNTDQRFYIPRESYSLYYRTSGITADTGSWTLIPSSGEISGSSESIQFKLTFRTIGLYTIPCRIKGIVLSYQSNYIPTSIPFYDPSLKFTDKTSNIFSWRQNSEFINTIPNLNINIYDTSNNLLLNDSVSGSTSGIWEYSNDDGNIWNSWVSSANTTGNYIRYSASTLSASGLIVKPILFI